MGYECLPAKSQHSRDLRGLVLRTRWLRCLGLVGSPFDGDGEVAGKAGFGDDGTCFGVESEAEFDGEFVGGEGLEGAHDRVGGGAYGGERVVEPFVEPGDDVLALLVTRSGPTGARFSLSNRTLPVSVLTSTSSLIGFLSHMTAG